METWDTPAYGAPASHTGVREGRNHSCGRPALAGCCPPPPWASVVGASWGTPCRKAPWYRAGTKSPTLQGKPGPWASLPHPTAVSLTGPTGRATGPAAAARGPGTWPVRTEAVVTVWQYPSGQRCTLPAGARAEGPLQLLSVSGSSEAESSTAGPMCSAHVTQLQSALGSRKPPSAHSASLAPFQV